MGNQVLVPAHQEPLAHPAGAVQQVGVGGSPVRRRFGQRVVEPPVQRPGHRGGVTDDANEVGIREHLPDLVDVPRTQVYEIKPNGIISFAAGEAQLLTYLKLFNALDPLKRTWKEGSSYTAPPLFLLSAPLVPPTFIETEPPIFGVILYSSIQDYVKRKARNVAVEENAEMDDSVGISVLDAFLGGLF